MDIHEAPQWSDFRGRERSWPVPSARRGLCRDRCSVVGLACSAVSHRLERPAADHRRGVEKQSGRHHSEDRRLSKGHPRHECTQTSGRGLSIVRGFVPKPIRLIILKLDYTVLVCLKHAF